jgi:formate dehydrogenase major subunit
VEIEGIPTLQTSCTNSVQEGMVVHTNTEKVQDARNFVLSLIFSERNHLCMVCPKTSSTCELQQAAYDIGMDHWSISPSWDEYPIDVTHPWMVWDHNRCILCQRCVRACDELVGRSVIVPVQRGAALTLTTDYGIPWGESSCVKCGTCLQVCPTGAILEKKHAEFEYGVVLEGEPGLCVECGIGCQTEVFTRSNQLVRINGDWAGSINHGLLCEKGRFIAVKNVEQERILTPMIRMDGKLVEVDWYTAIMTMLKAFENR